MGTAAASCRTELVVVQGGRDQRFFECGVCRASSDVSGQFLEAYDASNTGFEASKQLGRESAGHDVSEEEREPLIPGNSQRS